MRKALELIRWRVTRGRAQAAHRDESGQMFFAMAMSMVLAIMFLAVSLDAGFWFFDHRTAQNQADASAHSAALTLIPTVHEVGEPPWEAINAGLDWLERNGAARESSCPADPPPVPSGGDVWSAAGVLGEPGMVFWDNTGNGSYDTVRVCVQRQSAVLFGALADINTVRISASADATFVRIPIRYAIMAMHPTVENTLWASGNTTTRVTDVDGVVGGGGTFTNSGHNDRALRVSGNAELHAAHHDVVGKRGGGGLLVGPLTEGVSRRLDPFRHVDPPAIPGTCTTSGVSENSGTYTLPAPGGVGRHCGAVSFTSDVVVNVEPGIHIFHNGLSVTGQAHFGTENDDEVLLYFTCAVSPCNGANISPNLNVTFGGGVTTNLMGHCEKSPPPDERCTSPFEGILIYVDRTAGNPQSPAGQAAQVRLVGGSGHVIKGSVYNVACGTGCGATGDVGPFYNGLVNLQGGSCADVPELNVSVVAGWVDIGGVGCLDMIWDPITAPAEQFPALIN